MKLTAKSLVSAQAAARAIGEDHVTLASDAGVITFDFSKPGKIHARVLGYESQPNRQQLAAILGIPLTAETA